MLTSQVAAGLVILLGFASRVGLQVPPDCASIAADFEARVRAAVVGALAGDREAHVTIERQGRRYRVQIRAGREHEMGMKYVVADSCEQALAAAVEVLAIALSEPAGEAAVESGEPTQSNADFAAASLLTSSAVDADAPSPAPTREPESAPAASRLRLRLTLRAGVDAGTLPAATAYVGGAASWLAGPIEWRALLGLGLPYVEERVDPGIAERHREQFVLLDLGACSGVGERWRVAACAAGELGIVYGSLRSGAVADEHLALRWSGVLAAQLAYRGGLVQPELELAAIGTVLGSPNRGPLAVRASLGLGLHF